MDDVAPMKPTMGSEDARGPAEGMPVGEALARVTGADESRPTEVTVGLGEVAESLTGLTPTETFTIEEEDVSPSEGVGGVNNIENR